MKNKKIFIILIVFFIVYVLYKSFNLYYYTYIYTTDNEIRTMNYEKIDIKTLRMISNSEYDHLHINIPSDLKYNQELSEQSASLKIAWYTKEKKNNQISSPSLTINKSITNIDYFIKNGGVRKSNYDKTIKKYNIKNCFDLLEYYKKNQNQKQTIFTPISKIKMNHLAKSYVYFNLPSYEKVYKLSGGLDGYLFKTKNSSYFTHLIYNNDIYIIDFNNIEEDTYFTHEKVIEILQTIYFQ